MKRLGILAAVFVVLLGVLFLQRLQRREIVVSGPAETVKIVPDTVTRIAVHKPDGDVELERTGSEWTLVKPVRYPANGEAVQGLLKSLEELKLVDVISTNPATRGTYQVDSTGTAVDVWTGDKKALSLVVGKATADFSHTFVRRSESNDVYRADGMLAYSFSRRPEDWRDKSILKLEERDIRRVVLEYPKEKQLVTLARTDSTHWSVQSGNAAPQPADSTTVARLVGNVGRLVTVSFATAEEIAAHDFSAPDFRLEVDAGGTPRRLQFVAVDDTRFLARVDGNETVFSLYKSNLGNIMKKADELLPGGTAAAAGKKKA